MNTEELKILLGKYYKGDTSLKEERLLGEQLKSTKYHDDDLVATKMIFDLANNERKKPSKNVSEFHFTSEFPSFQRSLLVAASITLLILIGFFFLDSPQQVEIVAQHHVDLINLPDGTKVWLNEGSKLTYENPFDRSEVGLLGDAYFNVADAEENFLLKLGKSYLIIEGTEFNAFYDESLETVNVQLFSGELKVLPSSNSSELKLEENSEIIIKKGLEIERRSLTVETPQWDGEGLSFSNHKLAHVFNQLENAFSCKFYILNKSMLNCTLNGEFESNSLSDIINALEITMNLEITPVGLNEYNVLGNGCK